MRACGQAGQAADVIARYRAAIVRNRELSASPPFRIASNDVAGEAQSLSSRIQEIGRAIGALSPQTIDLIDAFAHGEAYKRGLSASPIYLRDLRPALYVLNRAALKCINKSKAKKSLQTEMVGHAAMLTGQTLREFGCELHDRKCGIFRVAVDFVFGALGIARDSKNACNKALERLGVGVSRGKPRGRQGPSPP